MSLRGRKYVAVSRFFYYLTLKSHSVSNFDVLLTVHLSIFISVFNQLDAQNHGQQNIKKKKNLTPSVLWNIWVQGDVGVGTTFLSDAPAKGFK